MSFNSTDNFLLGGGAGSAKFDQVGDTVTGTVQSAEVTTQTDIATGQPLTWDNGDVRQQLVVTLQTSQRDDADDDGTRKVYVKGSKKAGSKSLHDAVASAVRASGAKGLTQGGTLTIKYVGDEPSKTRGFNPRKLYEAAFTPPTGGDFLGTSPASAPAPAPQAAPAPAPATPQVSGDQAAQLAAFQQWQKSQAAQG